MQWSSFISNSKRNYPQAVLEVADIVFVLEISSVAGEAVELAGRGHHEGDHAPRAGFRDKNAPEGLAKDGCDLLGPPGQSRATGAAPRAASSWAGPATAAPPTVALRRAPLPSSTPGPSPIS